MLQATHPLPARAKTLAEQMTDFTSEGAPPPRITGIDIGPASGIGREDWTTLFKAVTTQLRQTVAVRPASDDNLQIPDAGRMRTRVLECVAALENLLASRRDARNEFEATLAPELPALQGLPALRRHVAALATP